MTSRSSNRTGIFIVRVWIEGDDRVGFRARITHTLDSTNDEQGSATAGDPEDVYALIQEWVEAFVDQHRANDDPDRSGVLAG